MILGNLKGISENHPFFVAVGVFMTGVGVGGVPLTIVNSGHEAEVRNLEADIDSLETDLGAVTRTVGKQQTAELSTDKIVVSERQAHDLSPNLDYVESDDFYAPSLEEADGWSFTVTDEAGLAVTQLGVSRESIVKALGESVAAQPVNLWRSDDSLTVNDSAGTTLSAFPFVAVERIESEDIPRWLEERTGTQDLTNFVADDPLGALFQLNIAGYVASSSPDFSAVLSGIQRTDTVLYCEITVILRNVKVDGVPKDRFYIQKELLFLEAGNDVIGVTTSLPSEDRRTSEAAVVTRLLDGLRVVE